MITDYILAIEGTPTGKWMAMGLALFAALTHALFGAMQKGRYDPWLSRGAMDAGYFLYALPFARFVVLWPDPTLWLILAGAWAIHVGYKILQGWAFTKGAYTVVYPVVRGTGPFFTVIGAYLIFGETFAPLQWLGVGVLMAGIFSLALYNMRHIEIDRDTLPLALGLAVLTGMFVALYTTYDAFGIRASANPFTFLVWFFVVDGFTFPIVAAVRWMRMENRPPLGGLIKVGALGGIVAPASFGSVMMATRLDKVGEAAVLRETSTIFAALIGWLVLKERVGPIRTAFMAVIAAGAVIVEFAG